MRMIQAARQFLILGLALSGMAVLAPSESRAGEVSIHPTVMRELNQVIRTSSSLHESLVGQDDEQLEIAIRDVIHQIDRVRTVAILAKQHERPHLLKILEAGRERLELAQTSFGEERRAHFQQAYNQLVNIVRIYKIDPTYSIFFCDRDKSSWVQKGNKALNPLTPAHRKCGMKVTK